MKEFSAEFCVNRRTVSTHLRRAKVQIRRGGLDARHKAEAVALYEAGWSSGRLAKHLGTSADTVLKALRSANVTLRPRQGGPASKPAPR
jgi:DNA-directed RNA polymerase specialized sigma24 family protein